MAIQDLGEIRNAWSEPRPRSLVWGRIWGAKWKILGSIALVVGALAIGIAQTLIAVSHGQM